MRLTRKLLLVLVGGFCGAIVRYVLAKPLLMLASSLPESRSGFPYDILLINLSGAFAIGLLFGAFEYGASLSPDVRLMLGTGFLGAYTTFSSYMVGAAMLIRHGQPLAALLYVCGAMVAGVGLAAAGFLLAGALTTQWRAWRVALSAMAPRMDDEIEAQVIEAALADIEGHAR